MDFEEALSFGWSEGAGGIVVAGRRRCSYLVQWGTSEAGQRRAVLWKSSETPPLTHTALDPARTCWTVPIVRGTSPGGAEERFTEKVVSAPR